MNISFKWKGILKKYLNKNNIFKKEESYIYLDSSHLNAIEQVLPVIQNLFLNKKVTILYKFYFKNAFNISKVTRELGIDSWCFLNNKELNIPDKSLLFYTHNAVSNVQIVNRMSTNSHILLLHGDSDKPASTHRLARIYDYCLVAGENSFQRYIKHGVFLERDRDKFIFAGKAILNSVIPTESEYRKERTLLFAPTWEGVSEDTDYSLLPQHEIISDFMLNILNKLEISSVTIKPHPNLGNRLPDYIEHLNSIIRNLIENGIEVSVVKIEGCNYSSNSKVISLSAINNNNIVLAVTNNSAMIMQMLQQNIKTVVLSNQKETGSLNYPAETIFIEAGVMPSVYPLVNYVNNKMDLELELIKLGKLSYDGDDWHNLNPNEIFNFVIKKIKSMRENNGIC